MELAEIKDIVTEIISEKLNIRQIDVCTDLSIFGIGGSIINNLDIMVELENRFQCSSKKDYNIYLKSIDQICLYIFRKVNRKKIHNRIKVMELETI